MADARKRATCPEHPHARLRVIDGVCSSCYERERARVKKAARLETRSAPPPKTRRATLESDVERARLTRLALALDDALERAATPWERQELRAKRDATRQALARVSFHAADD